MPENSNEARALSNGYARGLHVGTSTITQAGVDTPRGCRHGPPMSRINLSRLLIGAALAGLLSFFGDGLIHGLALKASWTGLLAAAGKKPSDGSSGFGTFLLYDFAR